MIEDEGRTDWYRFEFRETSPKLVFFQIELTERDQIPVNITVHRVKDGKLEEFFRARIRLRCLMKCRRCPGISLRLVC